jgi:hypothetical protein
LDTRGQEEKNNKREGKKGKKERKWIHIHRPLVVVGSWMAEATSACDEAAAAPCPSTCAVAGARRVHIDRLPCPVRHAHLAISISSPSYYYYK